MNVTLSDITDGGSQDELIDELARMRKDLSFLLENLDHLNVKYLYTEYCKIRSEAGETQIKGPVLEMYDKQATPVLRLKQGYDPVSGNFVYELYNAAGNKTISLDSSGNARLTGTLYSQDAVIGIGDAGSLNFDIGTGSYITLKGAYTVSGNTLVFCRTTSLGGSLLSLERIDFNAGWTYFYGSAWIQGNLDMDSGNIINLNKLSWNSVGAITSTTPAGVTGDMIWGTSSQGTGPHIWKAGGWYALQSIAVP